MVSARTSIFSAAVAVSTFVAHVNAHGYMLIPETQFSGSATSAWVVQIDPPSGFESDDWDGNEEASVTVWVELAATNGVTDLKTLLDGDTSLYGAECGYSDPDGEAQPIPSTSTATFSRAIQHVGPCEIWLDSTKVFSADNCYGDYESDGTSVFPVDYSQCDSGGCSEMRFYWLAFQGVDGETVWQTYKDCIPLEGSSSSTTSTTTSSTESEADTATTTSSATTSSATSDDESTETTSSATSDDESTETTSSATTESTSTTSGSATASSGNAPSSGGSFGGNNGGSLGGNTGGSSFGGGNGGNGGGWSGGFGRRHLKH